MHTTALRSLALCLSVVAGAVPSAGAQALSSSRVGLSPPPVHDSRSSPPVLVTDSTGQSYWAQGMIIGGIIGIALGLAAESAANSIGDNPNSGHHFTTTIISMFLFATIGGMIGSGRHKT